MNKCFMTKIVRKLTATGCFDWAFKLADKSWWSLGMKHMFNLHETPLRLRRKLFTHIPNTNNLTNECKGYILVYPDKEK